MRASMARQAGFRYRVDRQSWRGKHADVSLVRELHANRFLKHWRRRGSQPQVLWSRRFKRFESAQLERYATTLELVARHANAGTLGCFVDTQVDRGAVHVRLYERWFDGDQLHCEELAHRAFDAQEDGATAASAEFVAELDAWAAKRDEQREREDSQRLTLELEQAVSQRFATELSRERERGAQELARILQNAADR